MRAGFALGARFALRLTIMSGYYRKKINVHFLSKGQSAPIRLGLMNQ